MIIAALIMALIAIISLIYTLLVIIADGSDTAIRVGLYSTTFAILGAIGLALIWCLKSLITG
nr:MAG TPA: hypothetical protein [Caudoviricetes sp.]